MASEHGWAAMFVNGRPLSVSISTWNYRIQSPGEAILASLNPMGGLDLTQGDSRGQMYINRYETINAQANARMFLGYALMESGVGGDVLATARELALKTLNPSDETNRVNDVMNIIKSEFTAFKSGMPDGAGLLAEMYISAAGYSLVGQAMLMFGYNDFVNVPRIIQFAPSYYDAHIANNPNYGFSGGGDSHEYGKQNGW
jgi:hypothetical protein